MKAIVQNAYGSPDVFELADIDEPVIAEDDVLVRVGAAALHAGDVFLMRGKPFVARLSSGFPKPNGYVPGFDMAGHVAAVGENVTRFRIGDQVFGAGSRTCAEFVRTSEDHLVLLPSNSTLEQAAAVPTSACAALQGLRDQGRIQSGQKVLINGASGGVGTFAVQIAKAFGADVTGVCSAASSDMVRSIGADHVIDYATTDFTQGDQRYDLILDNIASRSLSDCRRVLAPEGKHIPSSGHQGIGWIAGAFVSSLFVRQQGRPFVAVPTIENLVVLKDLIEAGNVTPVIDRTYKLSETQEAFRYLDEGHARGKVVITMERNDA